MLSATPEPDAPGAQNNVSMAANATSTMAYSVKTTYAAVHVAAVGGRPLSRSWSRRCYAGHHEYLTRNSSKFEIPKARTPVNTPSNTKLIQYMTSSNLVLFIPA